jgi:hypothetical protein
MTSLSIIYTIAFYVWVIGSGAAFLTGWSEFKGQSFVEVVTTNLAVVCVFALVCAGGALLSYAAAILFIMIAPLLSLKVKLLIGAVLFGVVFKAFAVQVYYKILRRGK